LVWANNQVDAGATDLVFVSYAVIGLGMASPYLIIGAFPELISFLPKPGAWMETFKKVMGYLLLSAVVWLLYSMEIFNILPTITLLFAIWFALWLIGSLPPTVPKKKKTIAWTTSIVVVLLVWSISFPIAPFLFKEYNLQQAMQTKVQKKVEKQLEEWMVALDGGEKIALDQPGKSEQDVQPGEPQEESEEEDIWKPFSFDRLETSLEEGRPVMIDFTADWCATCKVLEAMVLDTPEVENVVEEKNILPLRADFTRRPPDLAKLLNAMGGEQVPVVAIFLPEKPNNPIVLRGLFRQKTLLEKLEAIE
jgi:thiol:disulfide interchange protein DsbD